MWFLLGRGFHREQIEANGVSRGSPMDECRIRGMWRHYKTLMTQN